MITNDYIKGYVEALNHLKETLNSFIEAETFLLNDQKIDPIEYYVRKETFDQVIRYVETVKDNYKKLVKKLNQENQ